MMDLHLPKLTSDQRERCDEKLTVRECFNTLKTFQKNKTPGNDGLTVEFYLVFWPIVGKHLIDCFNRPFAAKPSRDLLFIKLWAIT